MLGGVMVGELMFKLVRLEGGFGKKTAPSNFEGCDFKQWSRLIRFIISKFMNINWVPIILVYFPEVQSQNASSTQALSQSSQNLDFAQKQVENIDLDIKEEDLINFGYHNNRSSWTEQEEKIMKKHFKQAETDWDLLLKLLPGRNKSMCLSKVKRLTSHNPNKWTKKEDEELMRRVEEEGGNWVLVQKHFEGRTIKQLREHYESQLRPGLSKQGFSLEEDLTLISLLKKYGKNWSAIREEFGSHRCENQLKNRYYGRLIKIHERKLKNQGVQ